MGRQGTLGPVAGITFSRSLESQSSHVWADACGPRWATLGPAVARADDGRPADNGPLLIGQQVEVVAALVEETAGEVVVVVTTVVTVVEVDDGALVSG